MLPAGKRVKFKCLRSLLKINKKDWLKCHSQKPRKPKCLLCMTLTANYFLFWNMEPMYKTSQTLCGEKENCSLITYNKNHYHHCQQSYLIVALNLRVTFYWVSSSRLNVKNWLQHFHGREETLEVSTQNRDLEKDCCNFPLGLSANSGQWSLLSGVMHKGQEGKNTGTGRAGSRKVPGSSREHVGWLW